MDIYIGGIHDRNRALHGDVVFVQLKHPKDWKILWEDLWDYQKQQNCKLIDFNMYNINKKHNKSPTKNVNKNKIPVENSIVTEENIKKKKKNRNKINKKNITSLENEDIPREKNDLNNCIPLNEEESSTSLNNSVYKPQCEEIEVDSKLQKEQECGNKSDSLKQNSETTKQWTDSSSSLFIIPDDIVNCKSEFELPYFSDKTIDDDDNLLKSESVAVAPEELSGDEFSQSLSGESTCSYHLDQLQEDNRFMECLQDEANNNEEIFTVNAEDIINVNADQQDNDFNTFNQNTETYIQIGASTESTKYNNIEKDICTFDPSFSITYSNSNFNNHVPIDSTISDKYRTENFNNEKSIKSEILDYKQEDSNNRTSITAKNEVSNNHRKIKKKNKKHKSKNSEVTEETELNFHFLNVTQLMNHPHGSRFVQKTGKVVYIVEKKNTRKAAGFLKLLQDKNDRWALFSPTDHRLPRIFIPMKECPQDFLVRPDDFAKYLFLAQIIEWNEDSKYAKGKLIQKLGETGEVEAETQGILFENGIDTNDFSDKIEKELNEYLEWTIPEKDLLERKDFRKECVFTIDPSTARDLDDAVSCKLLQDGLYEVGVHIADVTYFVKENTALDATASDRATSIYLVQKVIPMLPPLLCERLCSLNPGEDRLTFSVIWKMNKEGEIFDEWFGRTMICSCMKLSYNHAQDMIEHPQKEWNISSELPVIHGDHKISDIVEKVICLNMIANKLREKRFRDGALRLDQVKLQFSLDKKTGLPSGFTIYEHRESNKLIEEFMLLANMAVAHRIYKSYPNQALLRRHPPPDKKMMNNIVNMCSAMGIELNSNSSGSLQASLNSLFGKDIYSKARIQVLTALCSKPMKCALYFNSGNLIDNSLYHHYALNVPLYTHFTSPIRRYPDIIVHRLLAASLGYCQPPNIEMKALQKLVDHCNDMKYTGKRVNEISSELFLFLFIKECGSLEEQAMVMGVMDHSFDVLLLRMGVVKRVYCDKLDLKKIFYEKERSVPVLTLIWNTETELKQQIKIFTLVDVIISVSSEETFRFNVVLKKPITTSIN